MTAVGGLERRVRGTIGLGTAGFAFGSGSVERSMETIAAAVDAGIVLVDTALAYTRRGEESTAESIVGAALRRLGRTSILVATKGGHWRDGDDFPVDDSAMTLRRHCEISLRTLGVTEIDLYQIHHVDPRVPIEESVGAMRELQLEGKIRWIGLSNVTSDQVARARSVAPIAAIQNRFSLSSPEDLPVALECAREGISYLAYMPLGGRGARPPDVVDAVAARRGASAQQVMLAWAMAQSASIIPIAGATRPETARDSAAAATLELAPEDFAALTAAVP